ncbi:MAG: hypothetical protein ABUL62_26115 [Myxococcales bacterium]
MPAPVYNGTYPAPPPTAAQLQGLFSSTANTGGTCTLEVDPETCPLAPASVTETSCQSQSTDPNQQGLMDPSLCAPLGPNYRCGYGVPPSCATNPERAVCKGKSMLCGLRDPACVSDVAPQDTSPTSCTGGSTCACKNVGDPACGCAEIRVCPAPDWTGNAGPSDPNAYVPTPKPTSQAITDHKNPPPAPVFEDDPNKAGCPKNINGNCWCKLGMDDPPAITDGDKKHGDHGGGSLIKLTFDPATDFNADLRPLPFGDNAFKVDASASFASEVTFTLPIVGSSHAKILDTKAQVRAERCRVSVGDTFFKVFDIDFVDLLGEAPFDSKSTEPENKPLFDAGEACESAISAFEDAGDRAKKALRDAQTLLLQYKKLASNQTFDKTSFCNAIGVNNDKGFPSGNVATCLAQTPESTINRYVTYYQGRIADLLSKNQALAAKTASFSSALSTAHSGKINFIKFQRSEDEEIFSTTFFVGPIPVNIAVSVMVNYGIDGNIYYQFSPPSGLALAPGTKTQLAGISGGVEPRAGAGIALFAGVGFGIPGFSVRAGIRGELNLASVSALLKSGVGLTMESQADNRPIPDDLQSVSGGALVLPTRQYQFYVDWFYSADFGLKDVLSGSLNAYVRLKALFFSKTFSKPFLTFKDPFNLNLNVNLLQGGGTLAGIDLPLPGVPANSLGVYEMQLPFVNLQPLPARPNAIPQPYVIDITKPLGFDDYCLVPQPK